MCNNGGDRATLSQTLTHLKIAAALKQLRYGISADALDESLQVSETVAREALKRFCRSLTVIYRAQWLRPPNREELDTILQENARRGFPGMIGSVDCMHWQWQNCPSSWKGQFQGKEGGPTLVLEAAWYVLTPHIY